MKYTYLNILLLLSACLACCAQRQTGHSDTIDYSLADTVTASGPNRMVRNVSQARNGDILFAGSWGGVFRYDGKVFTNIASKIGSRRFWDVMEDSGGNLWFASTDSGLYRYNGRTFDHFTQNEGLASNLVQKIFQDREGMLWFGSIGGLSRFDGRNFRNFTTKDGLAGNGIRDIMQDRSGRLWLAAQEGLCFYDGKKFTVLRSREERAFSNVWSIAQDDRGNIWFGDTSGLWRYDGRAFALVSPAGASAIIQDREGNLWTSVNPAGNAQAKLLRYEGKTLYDKAPVATEIMQAKMLCGILQARDGSIWFGSLNGLYRYQGKTLTDFKAAGSQ